MKTEQLTSLFHNYTVVLEPDDGAWLAYIPALPGCHAPGDSPDEALTELQVVFEMIVEEYTEVGRALPPNPAVEAMLPGAGGAFAI